MKITRRRFTKTFNILIVTAAALLAIIAPLTFLSGFSPEQQRTVGLLVFAIYLWTHSPLTSGAACLLHLDMMLILGLVDSEVASCTDIMLSAMFFIFMF